MVHALPLDRSRESRCCDSLPLINLVNIPRLIKAIRSCRPREYPCMTSSAQQGCARCRCNFPPEIRPQGLTFFACCCYREFVEASKGNFPTGETVFGRGCIDAGSVYHCLKFIEEREGNTGVCEKQSITQVSCMHLQNSTM